jgi:hypothetical protein
VVVDEGLPQPANNALAAMKVDARTREILRVIFSLLRFKKRSGFPADEEPVTIDHQPVVLHAIVREPSSR